MDIDCASSDFARLARSLLHYDREATLATLAGLLLIPELHRFTLRIEILLYLAVYHCNGKRIPKLTNLTRWLETSMPRGITVLEDPPSDVFVGNVMTPQGNYLLLQGVWSGNDLWLQQLLYVLFGPEEVYQDLIRPIMAMLSLSNVAINRAGLSRWQSEPGKASRAFRLNGGHRVFEKARYCYFTFDDLERIDIAPKDIAPFTLNLSNRHVRSFDLERFPLVPMADGFLLSLPTAVSIAIRRYALERLCESAKIIELTTKLQRSQLQEVHDRTSPMGVAFSPEVLPDPPPRPIDLPQSDLTLVKFDDDKYCLALIVHDDLVALRASGFDSVGPTDEAGAVSLAKFTADCVDVLSTSVAVSGGLVLTIVCGLGRGYSLLQPDLPPNWAQIVMSLADYQLLSGADDITLLRLWKLHTQMRALSERDLIFAPTNDELDRYGYWVDRGFNLLDPSFSYQHANGKIVIDRAFGARLRTQLRVSQDNHCAYLPSGGVMPVRRYQTGAYWKKLAG